jgi:hypothetical protein
MSLVGSNSWQTLQYAVLDEGKKKSKTFSMLNQLNTTSWKRMGEWCIDPRFLDLGTSWRSVVSFTPLPLYPRGKPPCTHWVGGWMDLRAGLDDMENFKFLTLPGLELWPLGRPGRRESPCRLRYGGSCIIMDNTFYHINRIFPSKKCISCFKRLRSSEMSINVTCRLLLGLHIESFRMWN